MDKSKLDLESLKSLSPFPPLGSAGNTLHITPGNMQIGAALLSAKSALRSGGKNAWLAVDETGTTACAVALPEAKFVDKNTEFDKEFELKVLCLHVDGKATPKFVEQFPGQKILSAESTQQISDWKGEATAVIVGCEIEESLSKKFSAPILAIGGDTVEVVTSKQRLICKLENEVSPIPGAAAVLAGVVSTFVAAGASPEEAVQRAAYLYKLIVDGIEKDSGGEGIIGSDLVARIPRTLRYLRKVLSSPSARPGLRPAD